MRQGALAAPSRMGLLVAVLATGLTLLVVPAAHATRYASVSGSAAASCATIEEACDIRTAVEGTAKNEPAFGEQVVVGPGVYHVTETLETGAGNMRIEGEGVSRPTLQGSTGQIIRIAGGGTLAGLTVEQESSSEAVFADNATLERMLVIGKPSGQMLCQCYDGLIRDSVFIATGGTNGGIVGVNSNGGTANETLRNDTIYSESKEVPAIWLLEEKPSGKLTMSVINTIAVNTAGGYDVRASESSTITLHHSDYASPLAEGTISDIGGQVTAAPLFLNLLEGNFREQPASPTIDNGVNGPENGTVDFAGEPRTVRGATDIGAFEYLFTPPTSSARLLNPCNESYGTIAITVTTDRQPGFAPRTAHYRINGGPEQTAPTSGDPGVVTLVMPKPGGTLEYWGEDAGGDAETPHNTSGFGVGGCLGGGSTPPPAAPKISGAKVTPGTFKPARHGTAFVAARTGARLIYTDSRVATTTLKLVRLAAGHSTSHGCAAGKPKKHRHPCRRTVRLASFTHADAAGANSLRLTGRLHNRGLPAGWYTLTLTPAAAGLTGQPVTVRFRIV
jgi:hypothetical protein